MTDPQGPDHWDTLASEIGASSPPPERIEEEKPPKDLAPIPAARAKSAEAPAKKPPRPPADWSRIAEDLGIEGREEPGHVADAESNAPLRIDPGETPAGAKEEPREPGSPFARSEKAAPESPTPTSIAAAAGSPDLEIGWGEASCEPPEPLVEATGTDLVPAGSEARLPGFPDERPLPPAGREDRTTGRRRRKRRQKPKQDGGEKPANGPVAEVASGESPDKPAGARASTLDGETKERPKRRRRRRGSGRKKGAGRGDDESAESGSEHELGAAREESEIVSEVADEADEREPDAQGEPADQNRAERGSRGSNRGIPTWEEAVGIVISANMESRAKNPGSTSSSRSRGPRGRSGRGRPGRGRPGDKPG